MVTSSTSSCLLLFSSNSSKRRYRMTTAKINVRYVNYVQLDRSLTPARKALSLLKSSFLEFGPQPKINDLPFGNRPSFSNPRISNNFITVSLAIGRLPARDDPYSMLLVCPLNFVAMMTRHQGDDFLVTSRSM